MKSRGESLGLATVYRQLEILVDEGHLDSIVSPQGEKLFRHCGVDESHHHHIICRKCRGTVCLDECLISPLEKKAKQLGFREIRHSLQLTGLCAKCAA